MKQANLSYRHGSGRVYACDLNVYDREKGRHVRIASVPMDEPLFMGRERVPPPIAERPLSAQRLIEMFPPSRGRKRKLAR